MTKMLLASITKEFHTVLYCIKHKKAWVSEGLEKIPHKKGCNHSLLHPFFNSQKRFGLALESTKLYLKDNVCYTSVSFPHTVIFFIKVFLLPSPACAANRRHTPAAQPEFL